MSPRGWRRSATRRWILIDQGVYVFPKTSGPYAWSAGESGKGSFGRYEHPLSQRNELTDGHAIEALALDANFWLTHNNLGLTFALTRAYDQAITEFQRAIDLSDSPEAKANLAYAYAVSGRSREARKILDELQTRTPHVYSSPFDLAVAYTGLGDRDRAFSWLEKAYRERVRPMPSLKVNPLFDPLHSDPRFAALIERMSLFDTGHDRSLALLPSKPRQSSR